MTLSVGKALQLLHVLAESEAELGISEIARLMKIPKATAYRMAGALEEHGFVRKNPVTMRYGLGLVLWELGRRAVLRLDLRPVAQSYLKSLSDQVGETSLFVICDSGSIIYLEKAESAQPIQVNQEALGLSPFHASAAGKLFLAYSPDLQQRLWRQGPLASYTPHTVTEKAALEAEFALIRERGWAASQREWRQEMSSVAVPVWKGDKELAGTIVVSALAERLEGDRIEAVLQRTLAAGQQMSRDLGYQLPGLGRASSQIFAGS